MRYEPDAAFSIGQAIQAVLYFCWGTNFLIIFMLILSETKFKARKYYYSKLRWRYACLRPTPKTTIESNKKLVKEQKYDAPELSQIDELEVSVEEDSIDVHRVRNGVSNLNYPKKLKKTPYKLTKAESTVNKNFSDYYFGTKIFD